MAKLRYDVPLDFVEQCTETLNEFGAVRRDSFIRFIETSLGVTTDVAEDILDKLVDRQDVYVVSYADTKVVKTDNKHMAIYKYLDIFDAFLCIYEEARKSEERKRSAFANRASFPADFTIYDTKGIVYTAFLYDAHLPQKLSVFKRKKNSRLDMATLIVFPVGANLQDAEIPAIEGPYRHAVVRKSASGNTVCLVSDMQGEKHA